MAFIYKTINLINNKIYIGQSVYTPEEASNYLGSGKYLRLAIDKYGKENFIREILEECENHLLDEREIFWISYFDSTNLEIGYNLLQGGQSRIGTKLPESTKNLISESVKKYYIENPEHAKDKLINRDTSGDKNGMYGKGYKISGDKNGMYNKSHREESKDKMSKSKKGKTTCTENTKKIWKEQRSGSNNPMAGRSAFDIWIEKYGIEEALIRKENQIKKMLETTERNKRNKGVQY